MPCPTVLVSAPHCLDRAEDRAVQDRAFQADLAAFASDLKIPLWDLHSALPAADFIDVSHFNPRNHERFRRSAGAAGGGVAPDHRRRAR